VYHMLMRDIIDVPVVETVVRLDDAADRTKREGVVGEFVLTRQVERNLSLIAQSVRDGKGRGHFLVGPYGSGKSHFLSYVSLVLSGEVACRTENPLASAAMEKRFMPCRVSLVNVRNDRRLEDAVLAEAERNVRALGAEANFAKRSRFIDYVDSFVRPVDSAGMDEYFISRGLPTWEKLKEDPDKAAVSAWGYIKAHPDCPEMPETAPATLLSQIVKSAKSLGYEGVVIVIDELSEFLKSKPSRVALNEDARYLQLMGELALSEKLWIVASLQEAIEQTGDIARDVIAKIKDRYPVKMSLDEAHIKGLIDGRLIRKKEGARERIREVWAKYSETIPQFKIDFEEFYRIYPIHPSTIRYLEGLKSLLSAHRGVVDFIVSQVKGDAKRGVKGLLDGPDKTLVTVDAIYDHFRDRIREDGRFAEFDTLVRRDMQHAAKKTFADEGDLSLANRACDILILNKIAELERPKSVSELVGMLMMAPSEVSSKANEQYLSDVILEPLLRASLFLHASHEKEAGKRVFEISLERNAKNLLQKEIDRVLSSLPSSDKRAIRTVFGEVSSEIPVREALNGAANELIIQWRGTQRRGGILWSESLSFAEVEQKIVGADRDFAIVLCPPDFKLPTNEPIPDGAVYWIPDFDKTDLSEMQKYYAVKILSEDASVEMAVKEDAVRKLDDEKTRLAGIVESGFKKGKFVWGGHTEERAFASGNPAGLMERFAARPVVEMLKGIHPKFLEVAPEVEFVSRRTLMPLIEAIIAPGRVTMAAARKNNSRTMIEGVLIPMGLARVQGPSFVMQADPSFSSLASDVLSMIKKDGKMGALRRNLRRGEYGLTKEMAELLIVSLVHTGIVDIKKGGRRIPSGIVGFSHVEEADEINTGELLPADLKKRLFLDGYLTEGIESASFSLSSQREAWGRLLEARDLMKRFSLETLPALSAISKYPIFDGFDFAKAKAVINGGLEAMGGVEDSKGAAKGLAQYLSASPPELGGILKTAGAIEKFAVGDSERVIRIADYLRGIPEGTVMPPPAAQKLADLKSLLESLTEVVLHNKVDDIFSAFDAFLGSYSLWYVDEHARAFPKERFKELKQLFEMKKMRALSLASGISGIHLVDGFDSIKARIDAALSLYCDRAATPFLRLKPHCDCGFMPGKMIKFANAADIVKMAEGGLKEAFLALSSPAILEKLVSRIAALRDLDRTKSETLESIFHKLRENLEMGAFVELLAPDAAFLLNEALKREVTIVKRKVGDLSERLSGRKLPPSLVREIFEKWLGNYEKGDVVIDMNEGDGDVAAMADSLLAVWIKDHELDDLSARLALVIPSGTVACFSGAELVVDGTRLKKMADLAGLVNASGDKILQILKRERCCRTFAMEAAKHLINHLIDGWRPEATAVDCQFGDIKKICDAAVIVAKPFFDAPVGELIRSESRREYAISFLAESHYRNDFPSMQIVEKLRNAMLRQTDVRDRMFAGLPEWKEQFSHVFEKHQNAVFLFLDAARWDIVAQLGEFIRKSDGMNVASENWCRINGADTGSWQRAFFGTSDADAISAILKNRGICYFADAETLEVRKRIKEEAGKGSMWLRVGIIDRLLHATTQPLHQLMDSAVAEVSGVIKDILPLIGSGRPLVLLTDHGFSETKKNSGRYCHDSSHVSDTIAAMIVYERRGV